MKASVQLEDEIGQSGCGIVAKEIMESISHDIAPMHRGCEHRPYQIMVFLHHLIELRPWHGNDQAIGQHDDVIETSIGIRVT